ncbi:hypothetical protein Tco_1517426 [Tanacetum coccineum]
MDNIRAQQKVLDDELVSPANRLKIWKSNLRLSSNLKSKESTLQVALDALKLTPFYKAFEISVDVPEIYMQEDMLNICPKLPGQIFEEPPLEEEILSFIRDLGHTGEIKFLSDVNGMYHNKTVDYVYLLWEDLVYQVENKNSKKNNDMDDFMFTKIRVISKHQDTQVYGVILPQHFINQAMLESEAYKTYLAYANGEKIPKPKYGKNEADSELSPKKKTATTAKGKRLKTLAKVAKPDKKKQPAKTSKAKGLTMLSEVTFTEADQMKLATKRSLIETHSSHASDSANLLKSSDKEDDDEVGLNDDDDDNDDDEDNDDDDDDADNQDDDD